MSVRPITWLATSEPLQMERAPGTGRQQRPQMSQTKKTTMFRKRTSCQRRRRLLTAGKRRSALVQLRER